MLSGLFSLACPPTSRVAPVDRRTPEERSWRRRTPNRVSSSAWKTSTAPTTITRSTWCCAAARASGSGTSRATSTSIFSRPTRRSTRVTHPRIREALIEQAGKVTLTSRAFRTDQLGPLYEEVHEMTGYKRMLPMNSGAEAVETAIKAARKWGYKVKGVAGRQGRDPRLHRQLPRPHDHDRRFLRRRAVQGRLRTVHAGFHDAALRRSRRGPRRR